MLKLVDSAGPALWLLLWVMFFLIPEPVNNIAQENAGLTPVVTGSMTPKVPSASRPDANSAVAPVATAPESDEPGTSTDQPTPAASEEWRKLDLVATAYNSLAAQTDSTPDIAAWGDKLKPGMKSIAVSRDLLKMGLDRGTRVRITGLQGEYVVLDKMNKRWSRRIDIYMGEDVKAALDFGKRQVVLRYRPDTPVQIADNR